MATFLFNQLVFGPIKSRRLGNSLGINLLPTYRKVCNFNCIYCECGNADYSNEALPKASELEKELKEKLLEAQNNNIEINSITFAGNGEPTLHPEFKEIIDIVISLRNQYCPLSKVSVLSNSTMLKKDSVVNALKKVDNRILKIDSGFYNSVIDINRPNSNYDLQEVVENLKKFNHDFSLQTMFLKGEINGKIIDNTTKEELDAWLKIVEELMPKEVMIYTIDRETPEKGLNKVSFEELKMVEEKLNKIGIINVKISI